jgi:two-component system cell cycle response regulator
MKALVIEPSRLIARLLTALFQKHGVDSIVVRNAGEGLVALESAKVDLICLAYELEDMNGIDMVTMAAQKNLIATQPVLMFASTHDKKMVDRALHAGVTECFSKHQMAELDHFVEHFAAAQAMRISGKVLLIEDSATSALFCVNVLSKIGLMVDHCRSAEEAVKMFSEQSYDLVLTDYILAGTDTGLAVIRSVRDSAGNKSKTPILAISALNDKARRIEILRHGANDFIGKPVLAEELEMRVYNLITFRRLMAKLEQQHEVMTEMAMHDQLTSLFNRYYLQTHVMAMIEADKRNRHSLSVAIVDIDHFKRVNDEYGHAAGDRVLIDVAETMQRERGKEDLVIRFGGEEFLIVMPNTPATGALEKAELLRQRIEAVNHGGLPVTVSIGIATRNSGETLDQQIRRADDAVYGAKRAGRNRVEVAQTG